MEKPTITFKHSGNAGDTIYSLPCIKSICQQKNAQATIFIRLNVRLEGLIAQNHPLGGVMFNQTMFDLIKPLLLSQPYINNVIAYEHESTPTIDYDLDRFRSDYKNLSAGNISQWIQNTYPELRPNLYEPSIKVEPIPNDYIIVNRTNRYQNLFYDYSQLKNLPNVYFVGVESEFKSLHIHNPNIQYLKVDSFLQMAQYIAGCKLFIGNQSMAFAIAEQLKVKRILEQFAAAPNVLPQCGEYYITHTAEQYKKALYLALNGESVNQNKAERESQHGC